jgi:hypothetical protein
MNQSGFGVNTILLSSGVDAIDVRHFRARTGDSHWPSSIVRVPDGFSMLVVHGLVRDPDRYAARAVPLLSNQVRLRRRQGVGDR